MTLTPTSQAGSTTDYAVQLTVTQADTQAPVTRFGAPVTVHLLTPAAGLVPSYSADGTTWKAIPKLAPGAVPVDAGYTLDPDGTAEIQTFVPGFFGLRSDTSPPTQPQAFAGHFLGNSLVLQWQGATDDNGTVASYDVLLDGKPVQKVKGTSRRVVVRAFHSSGLTVYRVRAVDPSGNLGKPTRPVAVRPKARPAGVPRRRSHAGRSVCSPGSTGRARGRPRRPSALRPGTGRGPPGGWRRTASQADRRSRPVEVSKAC